MRGGEPLLLLLWLLALVLAIVWILLPFAIFGIKPRLDRQNAILGEILGQLRGVSPSKVAAPTAPPGCPPHDFEMNFVAGSKVCRKCGGLERNLG